MEDLNTLREQFIASHPLFLGSDEQITKEITSFYENNPGFIGDTTATCNIASGCYYFPIIFSHHSKIFKQKTYSFADFAELIHPDDRMHYAEAMELAYNAIQGKSIDEITKMRVLFECHFRNEKGNFIRTNVVGRIINHYNKNDEGLIILHFIPLCGGGDMVGGISKGIYVMNSYTRKCILQNNTDSLTPIELEAAKLYLYRNRGDKLTKKMPFSKYKKYKLFKSIKQKLKYNSIGFATVYLHRNGLI